MQVINTKLLLLILAAIMAIGTAVAYQQGEVQRRAAVLQQKQEQIKRSIQKNRYDWDGTSSVGKFRLP
jgi:hypothetical protein